jgi:hypothetical protein
MTPKRSYDLKGERSPELLLKLAAEVNCSAVFATSAQIQVDIDGTSLNDFHFRYGLLREQGYLRGSEARCWHSKGGNWHVVVNLSEADRLTPQQRIMYALMLGSDPTREILNMSEQRHEAGTIVLFRPIGAVEFTVGGTRRSSEDRAKVRKYTRA